MLAEKLFIKNRKGQKLSIIPEQAGGKGLAFVMHGLGGNKEQAHIMTFADAFKEAGFAVVRFDTTNTYGESDGAYEDATTTNYYEDLEDVIAWASKQPWYQEPFYLVGHSLGGICTALYAEKHPEKIKGLAPISTVVSGKLSATCKSKEEYADWKRTGWQIKESTTTPGLMKKLKWKHMEDRLKYDLLPQANKLAMPVLLIVGEHDTSTPPPHQKILYDALPGEKELHVIVGAPHTFRDSKHLSEIKSLFADWIRDTA